MSQSGAKEEGFNGAPVQHAVTPGGHPEDRSQTPFASYHRKFANPAPLGLISFATTTFILSCINYQVKGVDVPNVVVGPALAYGGLCQLLAGMWEFAAGNTFGATAFSSYGGFWIAYATILWPSSGVLAAYTDAKMLTNALSLFLAGFFIVTFLFLVASLRTSIGLVVLFFLLDLTFLLLMIGEFLLKTNVTKAGGIMGILTAFVAYYLSLAGMLTPSTSFFVLPVGEIAKRD